MNEYELALARLRAWVSQITYKDWTFKVEPLGQGHAYLQVAFEAPSNVTGEVQPWTGRKWLLSQHMTQSEVVNTALKAVLTAEEHEAREQFLYRGRTVFDPHTDIEELLDATYAPKDVREAA